MPDHERLDVSAERAPAIAHENESRHSLWFGRVAVLRSILGLRIGPANRTASYPYLKRNRLPDVLAAIQFMALHAQYQMSSGKWALRMGRDNPDHWKKVFDDHPEFFRQSSAGNYALIWRRAYDPGAQKTVTDEQFDAPPDDEKKSRRPPVPEAHIKTLLDMAVNLHSQELKAKRERRWLITPTLSFAGSLIGAILGFVFHK